MSCMRILATPIPRRCNLHYRGQIARRDHRLKSIPGAPPNLLTFPVGCPFAPRCEYAMEHCHTDNPGLEMIATGHEIACWIDVRTGEAAMNDLVHTAKPLVVVEKLVKYFPITQGIIFSG